MSYECIYCNFSAPTSSRLNRHLSTQKHVRNELLYKEEEEKENVQEENIQEEEEKPDEEEFKCPSCKLVQSNNWCFKCNTDNTCQNCVGHGGDDNTEGHEEWICQTCFDNQPEKEEEEEDNVQEEDNIPDETQQIIDKLIEDVQDFLKKKENEDVQDLENEILDNNDRDPCPNSIMSPWITHDDGCSLCGKQETEQSICENACDEEEIVQRSDKNDDFDEFLNPLILDIQTIEMIKNINEILTTHPFILQTVNIFMNIVKWFSFPTAPFDVKLIQDDHKG